MKKNHSVCKSLPFRTAIALLMALFIMLSCTGKKNKAGQKDLIPEKAFASILTDIYLANGLLSLGDIRRDFGSRDSVLNFIDIIESHGYSYEKMNSTIDYYFTSKPKRLIKIYDQAIGRMTQLQTAMQDELMRQSQAEMRSASNYNVYYYPLDERSENPGMNIKVDSPGSYTITFAASIFPDDQSVNPHFSAWLVDADSVDTGKKKWLPTIDYFKDGYQHQYVYTGYVREKRRMIMKVVLYEKENNIMEWDRHARIEVLFSNFTASNE